LRLSSGEILDRALLIWAAGVRTGDFIPALDIDKTVQGRINVDEFLRADDSVFVIGDAANFPYRGSFLRMAVQFAIAQGSAAGQNILALIHHKPLRSFKPRDLGYLIPMANNRSCGIVLGLKVKGVLATFFHYFMCVYRTYSLRNKFGFFRELLKPGSF
jgi:NADH:ubiquinone reductase (H+-translocating)